MKTSGNKSMLITSLLAGIVTLPFLMNYWQYCGIGNTYCLIGLSGFSSIFSWEVMFGISTLFLYFSILLSFGAAQASSQNRLYLAYIRGERALLFRLIAILILVLTPGFGGLSGLKSYFLGNGNWSIVLAFTASLGLLMAFQLLVPSDVKSRPDHENQAQESKRNTPIVSAPLGFIGITLLVLYVFMLLANLGFDPGSVQPPKFVFVPVP